MCFFVLVNYKPTMHIHRAHQIWKREAQPCLLDEQKRTKKSQLQAYFFFFITVSNCENV